jgi:hypothetical protein
LGGHCTRPDQCRAAEAQAAVKEIADNMSRMDAGRKWLDVVSLSPNGRAKACHLTKAN